MNVVFHSRPVYDSGFAKNSEITLMYAPGMESPALPRYLVGIPDNGDSRWSRYGLLAL